MKYSLTKAIIYTLGYSLDVPGFGLSKGTLSVVMKSVFSKIASHSINIEIGILLLESRKMSSKIRILNNCLPFRESKQIMYAYVLRLIVNSSILLFECFRSKKAIDAAINSIYLDI